MYLEHYIEIHLSHFVNLVKILRDVEMGHELFPLISSSKTVIYAVVDVGGTQLMTSKRNLQELLQAPPTDAARSPLNKQPPSSNPGTSPAPSPTTARRRSSAGLFSAENLSNHLIFEECISAFLPCDADLIKQVTQRQANPHLNESSSLGSSDDKISPSSVFSCWLYLLEASSKTRRLPVCIGKFSCAFELTTKDVQTVFAHTPSTIPAAPSQYQLFLEKMKLFASLNDLEALGGIAEEIEDQFYQPRRDQSCDISSTRRQDSLVTPDSPNSSHKSLSGEKKLTGTSPASSPKSRRLLTNILKKDKRTSKTAVDGELSQLESSSARDDKGKKFSNPFSFFKRRLLNTSTSSPTPTSDPSNSNPSAGEFDFLAGANLSMGVYGVLSIGSTLRIRPQGMDMNDFDIIQILGKGYFGKVMKVKRKLGGSVVATENASVSHSSFYALKAIKKRFIKEKDGVERAVAELETLKAVHSHPFIVNLKWYFQSIEKIYFLMDCVLGGDLLGFLQAEGPLPIDRVRFYGAQIAMALQYLHEIKIVYRDLKLENILIDLNGYLKLADFGLAKLHASGSLNSFCGTMTYLSPEQVLQSQGYSYPVDWWAFGVLLYELLDGFPPFYDSENMSNVYTLILTAEVNYSQIFPPDLRDLVGRFLTRKKEHRLGTNIEDFKETIQPHPFFSSINWELLKNKEVEMTWPPRLADANDVSYFDSEFTKMRPVDSVNTVNTVLDDKEFQSQFDAFPKTSALNNKMSTFKSAKSGGPSVRSRLQNNSLQSEADLESFRSALHNGAPHNISSNLGRSSQGFNTESKRGSLESSDTQFSEANPSSLGKSSPLGIDSRRASATNTQLSHLSNHLANQLATLSVQNLDETESKEEPNDAASCMDEQASSSQHKSDSGTIVPDQAGFQDFLEQYNQQYGTYV